MSAALSCNLFQMRVQNLRLFIFDHPFNNELRGETALNEVDLESTPRNFVLTSKIIRVVVETLFHLKSLGLYFQAAD
jgi:hypothetical protein